MASIWRIRRAVFAIATGVAIAISALLVPIAVGALSPALAALWLTARVIGSVVTVPIAEELAFRGYLYRRFIGADFERVSFRSFTWLAFLVSSLLFGIMHGRWLAGTLAGMAYALALYRRGELGDAISAHAITNALIAIYVLATGHWLLVGSPQQVAEALIERVEAAGADGFVVMPPYLPEGLERFVDTVVPILQDRGAVRREYAETTLRGHLGLPRPVGTWGITGSVR